MKSHSIGASAILILIIAFRTIGFGQSSEWQYYFSNPNMSTVTETDSDIWIGTFWYGLIRYSKVTGKSEFINKTNSPLNDYYIQDLHADHENNLWVISSGVLQCYTGSQWIKFDSVNSPINSNANYIYVDIYDNKWISTQNGFFKYDNQTWSEYHCPGGSDAVGRICVDNSGIIYINANGLSVLNNGNWTQYNDPALVTGFSDMNLDVAGNLWMVSYLGLEKFKNGNFTVWNMSNSNLSTTMLNAVAIDQDGIVWIGFGSSLPWNGWYGGMLSFAQNSFSVYDESNLPLNTVSVLDIMMSANGKMWAVDGSGYLISKYSSNWNAFLLKNSSFTHYMLKKVFLDQQQHPYVQNFGGNSLATIHKFDFNSWWPVTNDSYSPIGITIDNQNRIWMKNYLDSLVILDGINTTKIWSPQFHAYGAWNAFPADRSLIYFDNLGNLWMDYADSTVFVWDPYYQTGNWYYVEGFAKFDGSNWAYFTYQNSLLSGGDIFDVKCDAAGNIWVYEQSGVLKFDGTIWEQIPNQPAQNYSAVGSIAIDSIGNLWTSDGYNGLAKYDGIAWEIFPNDDFFGVSQFANLTFDIDGTLWGNYTSSIWHYDGTGWSYFDPENSPFVQGNIVSIAIDTFGNKYFATTVGLFIYKEGGVYFLTGISDTITDNSNFLIFPNPNRGEFTLNYSLIKTGSISLEIFDAWGNKMEARFYGIQTSGIHQINYHFGTIQAGIYFIRLISNDKVLLSDKLIVFPSDD